MATKQKPAEKEASAVAVDVVAHEQQDTKPLPQVTDDSRQTPAAREFIAQGLVNAATAAPNHDSAADATPGVGSETASLPLAAAENQTADTPIETAQKQSDDAPDDEPEDISEVDEPDKKRDDIPKIDLPPELMKAYASRIQPLLLNRCGAGNCHGHATTSSYQLHRLPNRRNPPREITMRNLSATLQQLDRLDPENSPLLVWGQKAHGRMRSRLLAVSNAKQQQLLADWLKDVAAGNATSTQGKVADPHEIAQRPTSGPLPKARRVSIQWQNQPRAETATGDAATKAAGTGKEDPFDPRSFNIEFAPKTR